jgi:type II secretory pathway pseudopilin PulG
MELLVYMMIVGIIVIVAGQAFSNSTKFRVRSQNMLKATQEAENVGILFKEDIQQTGSKSSKETPEATHDTFYVSPEVYIAPTAATPDSSSFSLTNQTEDCPTRGCNTLSFVTRRMVYGASGLYKRVEAITWTYNQAEEKLYRSCEILDGKDIDSQKSECPENTEVEIADGVSFFRVVPATPGVVNGGFAVAGGASLLPSADTSVHAFRLNPRVNGETLFFVQTTPETGGDAVDIKGFATNYKYDEAEVDEDGVKANELYVAMANAVDNTWDKCKKVNLEANTEYEIFFKVPYSADAIRTFCQGRDHAAVGFRTQSDGNKIAQLNDFLFFPPISPNASEVRSMRFSLSQAVSDVCLMFTFASYSPLAGTGTIQIGGLTLRKVPSANYVFNDNFATTMTVWDKKNVKAVRLDLTIHRKGETGEVSEVVPIPSNGPRD